MKKHWIHLSLVLCLLGGSTVSAEQNYNWIEGGTKVSLKQVATVDLDPSLVFLDAENTMKMSRDNNQKPRGNELGSIFSADEKEQWSVIFRYEDTGYIKDADKEKIDPKAILKSYKEGTEEANKERTEGTRIHVTGWDVEPFYDKATHNLTWSMLAEYDDKEQLVNYNVRMLTREGYISAILISDPKNRETDKKQLIEKILPKLTVNAGEKYEEFNASTDKVSQYGLTGLILGGAGLVIAKKVGLIATLLLVGKKFGLVILVALGALGTFIKKLFSRKKRAEADERSAEQENL
ncbi:DUF2167 domain-containing protein [Paenibacillus sp. SYP-B3998]|uniref:DUF2167 domain-containing protein n=1 Tax=Paenibacillus sp. SYP-B3998 TaxID=2678564 RepID=UPI001968237D|nr:DUF2167 domain-containing protein [Paenibacillus sp. SYP-B3998]